MTPESLARTIAKARYGTDAHWAAMLPAAEAIHEELINEAFRQRNAHALDFVRSLVAQPEGPQ